jgi:hypothetical protein
MNIFFSRYENLFMDSILEYDFAILKCRELQYEVFLGVEPLQAPISIDMSCNDRG